MDLGVKIPKVDRGCITFQHVTLDYFENRDNVVKLCEDIPISRFYMFCPRSIIHDLAGVALRMILRDPTIEDPIKKYIILGFKDAEKPHYLPLLTKVEMENYINDSTWSESCFTTHYSLDLDHTPFSKEKTSRYPFRYLLHIRHDKVLNNNASLDTKNLSTFL